MFKQIVLLMIAMAVVCISAQVYDPLDQLDVFFDNEDLRDPDLGLRGGCKIPAIGEFRVPIIFVDREFQTGVAYQDNVQSVHWPLSQDPVDMQLFINPGPPLPGQQWQRLNLTKYMHQMSNGLYSLVGDIYRYTIPSTQVFNSHFDIPYYVLQQMDAQIDYSLYDNWSYISDYEHEHIPNGQVDWVFLIYRFSLNDFDSSLNYTGYTPLLTSYFSSSDGVSVSSGSVQSGMRNSGFNGMTHVCLHELSHSLFKSFGYGGHNGRLAGLSILSANQVGWGAGIWGMNAWERQKLAWMNYNTVANDDIITIPDYMTSFTAVQIPTSNPSRFYVIENRQKLDPEFDTAFGKGLYIYRATDNQRLVSQQIYNPVNLPEPLDLAYNSGVSGNYDGSVNVLSADGRWNFIHNLSPAPNYSINDPVNIRIQRTTPNPRGYDERDYCGKYQRGSTNSWGRYYCLNDRGSGGIYHWYQGDPIGESDIRGDGFGDNYDGFSLNYNRVFSKWSNPGIDQSWADCNFSVEILSENTQTGSVSLRLRFNNPENAPLARPMGLSGTSNNGVSYALNWFQPNTELQPGFQTYELYHRRNTSTTWNLVAQTPNQNINLSIPYVGNPNIIPIHKRNYFKLRAVKSSSGGESNFSDEIRIINNDISVPFFSIPSGKTLSIDDSISIYVTGSLEMQENSGLLLGRGSKIIVQDGASLNIGNNCLLKGTNKSVGTESGSAIIINGSISVGTNVVFSSDLDCWDGLIIDSESHANLYAISFNKADLSTYSVTSIESCMFSNCVVKQYAKDLSISNSNFSYASVKSVAKLEDSCISIISSQFSGTPDLDAIEISSIAKYTIANNSISGYKTAIASYESMNGKIESNEIVNNETGIQLYHAVADIYNGNIIQNNNYGIVALRNSLWSLQGSKDTPYQFVIDNDKAQIIFTYDSAPEYMEFNHIYDSNNCDQAFVICEKVPDDPKKIIAANNYFGSVFNPFMNLIPSEIFIYEPVWEPAPSSLNASIIPSLYKTAKDYQRAADFCAAQSLWYQYFSAVADSSILFDNTAKHLLSVEKLTSDNYLQMLSFYSAIGTTNTTAAHLLSYLSNYCLIEENNLQPAILWLESQIENPITDIDSLFAAIDIGYLYMLADSNKATIMGKLSWLKPTSIQAYESDRRNAIMSILNGQGYSQSSSQPSVSTPTLLRNYPNPFNPSTTISFNLPSSMKCKIEIL